MNPSTDWKEEIAPDEKARFERFAEVMRDVQRKNVRDGKVSRALHAKGRGGFEAEFTVLSDLPAHARFGLFAEPKTFKAYVRLSNGSPRHQSDRRFDVRGFAIKVVGVDGAKVIPGMEHLKTQDFLTIRTSSITFRTADEFVAFVQAASGHPALLVPKMIRSIGLGRTLQIVKRLAASSKVPAQSFAAGSFYSAAPVKYGPYAARFSLRAHAPSDAAFSPTDFAVDMANRLRAGDVSYDFMVQFFVDEKRSPIEDASVDWAESISPYVKVAQLVIRQQDADSSEGRQVTERVETLSFDPWHALVDHRPLGGVMRARNVAYRVSTQERQAAPESDLLS